MLLLVVLLFPREADTDLLMAPLSRPPVPERPSVAAKIFQSEHTESLAHLFVVSDGKIEGSAGLVWWGKG